MSIDEQYDKLYRYCFFKLHDRDLEDRLTRMVVRSALDRLEESERELLLLRYVNELPVAAIGAILGISRFAAYRKITSASKRLRAELKEVLVLGNRCFKIIRFPEDDAPIHEFLEDIKEGGTKRKVSPFHRDKRDKFTISSPSPF